MMATQKIEIDLSKLGPVLKPYIPALLRGLTVLHTGIVTVGAALQKLDNELKEGMDAVPSKTPEWKMDPNRPKKPSAPISPFE
jgi:hypothetical protein